MCKTENNRIKQKYLLHALLIVTKLKAIKLVFTYHSFAGIAVFKAQFCAIVTTA
jgi:hypothetical protein